MLDTFTGFFNPNYMPHGHCYLWQPAILWTNVIADLLIASAYFSIPIALFIFIRQRQDLKYKRIFILFALFILCCGITHLFAIYTIWHGSYGLHGILKAITAIVSVLTAFVLFKNINTLLAIPSTKQFEQAISKAEYEKSRRFQLEQAQKAEAIFKFSLELQPTALLVVDANQVIRVTNKALERLFQYDTDELIGKSLHCLLLDEQAKFHHVLTKGYFEKPAQGHAMAQGRTVRGKTKYGEEIWIEINLSIHHFENEKHAFASVNSVNPPNTELNFVFEKSNRLQRVIDATEDGIWEWNIQTNDVWYSNRLMQMLGCDPETIKPDFRLWQDHVHPDDKARVFEALDRHLKYQEKYDVTYRGLSENQQYQWIRTRGKTIYDTDNKPLLMSGTLTNINQLKELELQFSQKSHFLKAVLNKSLCAIFIYNIHNQKITFINEQYSEITGYSFEQLNQIQYQHHLFTLFHPDDQTKLSSHYNTLTVNKNKEAQGLEFRIKHAQGQWIWCLSKDSPYSFDEQGQAIEIIGTFFDVSEQKQQRDKIKALAQDFYTTFEQAAVGIAHVGLDGTWLKANRKLCEILGYSHDELLSFNFQNITYPEDLYIDLELVAQLLADEFAQYSMEKRYICKNGKIIWAFLTVSVVRDEYHNPSHFISVVEDISERKAVEQALAESNLALEKFAYSASHDLQEPLRKISAFSDSLSERLKGKLDDEDAEYELSRLTDAASRMRGMIHSLLQLSRYSKHQLNKEPIRFSDLLAIIREDLSELIMESDCNLILEQDFTIYADLNSFLQVLRNLITNSIRYKQAELQPIVKFSHKLSEQELTIRVSDNGTGFDEKYASEIFQPFKRLASAKVKGYGMGLAICKQIIKAHGGEIKVESHCNQGTTFTVILPIEEKI
ncbi:PAS domain S-box protein [Pseudoalteromonas tunicata]|uniref:PAS domain S-box protein n=1 Tax=Pseudoalteromonas tunicata TaxID=314281 RepID=UPI0027401C4A|nr:PAS domain S-box protein [Pseudoalteromonas tunicata]MDP5212922.1 PAS domain S-box protein [Pseudoalteromonas tunicata]